MYTSSEGFPTEKSTSPGLRRTGVCSVGACWPLAVSRHGTKYKAQMVVPWRHRSLPGSAPAHRSSWRRVKRCSAAAAAT